MTNKLQIVSINILNSKYKFLFTFFVYLILYYFFYVNKNIVWCMNDSSSSNEIPLIAESKPTRIKTTRSIIEREVIAFTGYAKEIEEQKALIERQHYQLNNYKQQLECSNTILNHVWDSCFDQIFDRELNYEARYLYEKYNLYKNEHCKRVYCGEESDYFEEEYRKYILKNKKY